MRTLGVTQCRNVWRRRDPIPTATGQMRQRRDARVPIISNDRIGLIARQPVLEREGEGGSRVGGGVASVHVCSVNS